MPEENVAEAPPSLQYNVIMDNFSVTALTMDTPEGSVRIHTNNGNITRVGMVDDDVVIDAMTKVSALRKAEGELVFVSSLWEEQGLPERKMAAWVRGLLGRKLRMVRWGPNNLLTPVDKTAMFETSSAFLAPGNWQLTKHGEVPVCIECKKPTGLPGFISLCTVCRPKYVNCSTSGCGRIHRENHGLWFGSELLCERGLGSVTCNGCREPARVPRGEGRHVYEGQNLHGRRLCKTCLDDGRGVCASCSNIALFADDAGVTVPVADRGICERCDMAKNNPSKAIAMQSAKSVGAADSKVIEALLEKKAGFVAAKKAAAKAEQKSSEPREKVAQ